MYIAATRKVAEMKNKTENSKVSINNINLSKRQQEYESRIEKTHELQEYQSQLQAGGHKIRSNILGKAIEFSNKRDERVRLKLQKLLNTKSELLKIESARQFYDSYDFTINQYKVLAGEKLNYNDINETVFQDELGNLFVKDSTGKVSPVPSELWHDVAHKHGIISNDEEIKGKVA